MELRQTKGSVTFPEYLPTQDQFEDQDLRGYDIYKPNVLAKRGSQTEMALTSSVVKEQASKDLQLPLIAKAMLSELDIHPIAFNPKLRHDVNFKLDLHFRSDLDGECGCDNIERAKTCQGLLRTESAASDTRYSDEEHHLIVALTHLQDQLESLISEYDKPSLKEMLLVWEIVEQFRHGLACFENLSFWLSRTLKSYCAPERDEQVDKITKSLNTLSYSQDFRGILEVQRSLSTLLWQMQSVCQEYPSFK